MASLGGGAGPVRSADAASNSSMAFSGCLRFSSTGGPNCWQPVAVKHGIQRRASWRVVSHSLRPSVSPARAKARAARIWESRLEARAIAARNLLSCLGRVSQVLRLEGLRLVSTVLLSLSGHCALPTSAAWLDSSLAFVGVPHKPQYPIAERAVCPPLPACLCPRELSSHFGGVPFKKSYPVSVVVEVWAFQLLGQRGFISGFGFIKTTQGRIGPHEILRS